MSTTPFTVSPSEVESSGKAKFDEFGLLLVRGLLPTALIEQFSDAFRKLIRLKLGRDGENLDEIYAELCESDPEAALIVKGMGKDLVEYHQAVAAVELRNVLTRLMATESFQVNYDQCLFRIDRPDEDARAFDWHQDYLYNMLSKNAITAWAPLTPISSDMGPLRVVPGTHRSVLPVNLLEQAPSGRFTAHRRLELCDIQRLTEDFDNRAVIVTDVLPGDVLFLHSCVAHRSGPNRSKLSRWVFNPRYGDLADPEMLKRNWRTARAKDPFLVLDLYPEMVTTLMATS